MSADGTFHIAIVGMAGRFPRADGLADLRTVLLGGTDCVRPLSDARRDLLGLDSGAYPETAFLDDIALFDHDLFGISQAEAARIDPEQRHLMELAYLALLDGGVAPTRVAGSDLGIYVGCSTGSGYGARQGGDGAFALAGTMQALAAGRISHWLDCHGPAEVINTACSASLVAMFSAMQALRSGQAARALAGGFNAYCASSRTLSLDDPLGIRSPGFRCRPFDAAADGIGVGEGGGMVLLMRLEDAIRGGENIHAVIRGGAVSHDGRSPNGLTAPNVAAQRRMYRLAWADAEVEPADFGYLEAHGTGTNLGDPIEYKALLDELTGRVDADHPPVVGSAKSNFGHLDNAAGIVGLLKCVLSLKHRERYGTVHFETPNPHMGYAPDVLAVRGETTAWPEAAGWCAGVSAFGLSGTNAHLVLEPAPLRDGPACHAGQHMIRVSARAAQALSQQLQALAGTSADVAGLSRTLVTGREDGPFRASAIIDADGEAGAVLRSLAARDVQPVTPLSLVLLLGNTAPDPAAVAASLESLPVMRSTLEELGVRPDLAGLSAHEAAFHSQYALAKQLSSWGVEADSIIGSGVGPLTRSVLNGNTPLEAVADQLSRFESTAPDKERLRDAARQLAAKGRVAFVALHKQEGLLDPLRELSEAGDVRLDAWFGNGQGPLHCLSRLYDAGLVVDWAGFETDVGAVKCAVPAPPLARVACWTHDTPPDDADVEAVAPGIEFSTRAWEPVSLRAQAEGDGQRVLVIEMEDLACDAIAAQAEAAGLAVTRWRVNEGELQSTEDGWSGDVSAQAATQVFGTLKETGTWPAKVVLAGAPQIEGWSEEWVASVARVFDVVRAIAGGKVDGQTGLYMIGSGGSGFAATHLHAVFRRGLGRTIAKEFSNISVTSVDVTGTWDMRDGAEGPPPLGTLLRDPVEPGYDSVAICAGQVFAETQSTIAAPEGNVSYPAQPVVLMTGGLGGIARALAVSLAQTCGALIALVGRRSLDDAYADDPELAADIARDLAQIVDAGGAYRTFSADVSDAASLRKVRDAIEADWGPVQGIVHAAGTPGGCLIRMKSEDGLLDVARPKLSGLDALVEIFGGCPMDFVALMSSLSIELGAIGQAEYCATNLVLNEYATTLRSRLGWPAVAIGWDRWENTGMSRNLETGLAEERAGLTPHEAVSAFHKALTLGKPVVFVSKGRVSEIECSLVRDEQEGQTPLSMTSEEIKERLLSVARNVLGNEDVDPTVDLFDYGADSMDLIEIFHEVNEIAPGRVSVHDMLLEASIKEIVALVFQGEETVEPDEHRQADRLNIVTLDL